MNKTIKTVLFATLILTVVGVSASILQVAASPSESVNELEFEMVISTSPLTAIHNIDTVQITDHLSVELHSP